MMLAPGRDAADDEEPLPRLDEPEPPCLAYQLSLRAGLGKALLEPCLLRAEHTDVGLSRVEALLRAHVRVSRLPVEERDQEQAAERKQPGRSKADHSGGFSAGGRLPTCEPRRCTPSRR